MRENYKHINGREVRDIGYDPEKKICVIQFNHVNCGKRVYYHDVEQTQFDELLKSDHIAKDAETILKNNI